MGRLIFLLVAAGAAYYAYESYFAVEEGPAEPFTLEEPWQPSPEPRREEDLQRSPSRGGNPFVLDANPSSPPQRHRVPKIPGR